MKLYAKDDGYVSAHNAKSPGEICNRPANGNDVGQNMTLSALAFGRGQRQPRAIKEPGTFWEYNDVRINRMSLTPLQVWRALPGF